MFGGEAPEAEKEEEVKERKRGDWKQNRIVMVLSKTMFCTLLFHVTLTHYLHQPTFSSAVNFRRNQDGDGPGGEGLPCPRPVALLSPGGAEGSGPTLASGISG